MTPSAGAPTRRRDGHYSAWRALAAVPAMVGSLFLVLIAFAFLGRWEGVALLGWLASGALMLTRTAERVTVRLCCGFRRPTPAQRRLLDPVWQRALARCSIPASDVDWYVQRSRGVNAFATGGHSVAITTGVIKDFQAGWVSDDLIQAVITHDLLTAPLVVMPEMTAV